MDNIRLTIKDKYRKLQDAAELITAQSVKDAYLDIQNALKDHKLKELLKYYKEMWEVKLRNGGFKNYKTTITYIELFLDIKYPSGDVYLSQVN